MGTKQQINCTVETCKYNNYDKKLCELEAIMVSPTANCKTKTPEESQCSSYENILR